MWRGIALGLRVSSVLVGFALVLEGPDLLLFAVLDVRRWFPLGFVTGLLTLPLLWWQGVGFVPPWTMPRYASTPLRRVAVYHLTCSVLAAWLWTYPTLRVVAWVSGRRGDSVHVGTVPADVVTLAGGLFLAALLFFCPAVVLFVRLSEFRTSVDLDTARVRDLLRPAVLAVGGWLLVGVVVTLCSALVVSG